MFRMRMETNLLTVDLVDACNLTCPTCVRGSRYMKNRKRQMDFDYFKAVAAKAVTLGIHSIEPFNWTEPFLAPDLPAYARHIKSLGLVCLISSNLSLPNLPHLIPTLQYCDKLVISLSGFSNEVYRINHRGGNIDFVKNNLKRIAEAKKNGEITTQVEIRYFIFEHSKHEYPLFVEFAEQHGLNIVQWSGLGNPFAPQVPLSMKNESAYLGKFSPPENFLRIQENFIGWKDRVCPILLLNIPLDCNGDVFLCCSKPSLPSYKVGNFLEDDFDVIQYRRHTHPLCASCRRLTSHQKIEWADATATHKQTLLRGFLKTMGADVALVESFQEETRQSSRLAGQEVYFWGCGGMFRAKRHLFRDARPRCILLDQGARPDIVSGLPVRHPDDVLPGSEPLPVVVFAGEGAYQTIAATIRQKYPQFTDIVPCTEW